MLNKWIFVSRTHFPFSRTRWLLSMEVFLPPPSFRNRNGYCNIWDHLCDNMPYQKPFSRSGTFLLPFLSERRQLIFLGYCLKSFITNEYSRCSLNCILKKCALYYDSCSLVGNLTESLCKLSISRWLLKVNFTEA